MHEIELVLEGGRGLSKIVTCIAPEEKKFQGVGEVIYSYHKDIETRSIKNKYL